MNRRISPEFLDVTPEPQCLANLRDLVRINRWLGGRAILKSLLRPHFRPSDRFSVLDVGAASGDMGGVIHRGWTRARVVSADSKLHHMAAAADPRVVADAFHLPFRDRSFDVVFCSLFLHHFENDRAAALLRDFDRIARRGVLVIDLERHWFARRFVPSSRWLFDWDPITLHDAVRSVEAGFLAPELRALAQRAGLANVRVRRHLPWMRLSVTALREG